MFHMCPFDMLMNLKKKINPRYNISLAGAPSAELHSNIVDTTTT